MKCNFYQQDKDKIGVLQQCNNTLSLQFIIHNIGSLDSHYTKFFYLDIAHSNKLYKFDSQKHAVTIKSQPRSPEFNSNDMQRREFSRLQFHV